VHKFVDYDKVKRSLTYIFAEITPLNSLEGFKRNNTSNIPGKITHHIPGRFINKKTRV
jgi:hypothetical protein